MKIQNPIKLIIKFFGGGLINFPTRHIRWIKVEPDSSSDDNIPSGDITIDDVVKFIHDTLENENVAPGVFPYTTWNDIPDYLNANMGKYCKASSIDEGMSVSTILLNIPQYAIFQKGFNPMG